MFQTILVATDGSETARTAEATATELALATGGQLLVVSAYQGDAEAKASAERAVEEAQLRGEAAGAGAWTHVAEGDPAAAIVEFADHVNAELIVVGDIGMAQGGRLRLGGVPDRITHSAPCSVLIVRTAKSGHGTSALPASRSRYGSVLIATDGSPTAAHAAHLGAELGRGFGASVTLVYVGDELLGRIVLKDAAERLGAPDLPQRLARGEPGRAIARLADAEGSDLVVVGNKGLAGARRVLGSVPNTVSHEATCDVLVVHTVGRSAADLKPGEGAIVEDKGRKLAAYRDPSGELIALSKKCTHLGCSVEWNRSLETWDCPCHGSRYDARGKVIQGPAQRDLERVQVGLEARTSDRPA